MSITEQHFATLTCDLCMEERDDFRDAQQAERYALRNGWKQYGEDWMCPECAAVQGTATKPPASELGSQLASP